MTNQEELHNELIQAVYEATRYGITEGVAILNSPFSKESKTMLGELLMEQIPLLKKPNSDELMTEFHVTFNEHQGVDIQLIENTLMLTTWGGIRPVDGVPETRRAAPKE